MAGLELTEMSTTQHSCCKVVCCTPGISDSLTTKTRLGPASNDGIKSLLCLNQPALPDCMNLFDVE